MFGAYIIQANEVTMMGRTITVKVYVRHNGRYFAATRLSEQDIIITDGITAEDALEHHTGILPLAIDCRRIAAEQCHRLYRAIF